MERPWRTEMRSLDERDLELMNLPKRYWETERERIPDEPGGEETPREMVDRYIEHLREMWKKGHGLMFYGPNGVGKSAALAHILKTYRQHGRSTLYARAEALRSASIEGKMIAGDRDLWEFAQYADVLLLDDLGKEYESGSGFVKYKLEDLIRARYGAQHPTLVATNMKPANLEDKYKQSTVNVLKNVVSAFLLHGSDQREQEAEEAKEMLRS